MQPAINPISAAVRPATLTDRAAPAVSDTGMNGESRNMVDVKPTLTEENNDKSKIWDRAEISEATQCRSLRLADNVRANKISRLIYTNSGNALLALASNATHHLWKWQRNDQSSSVKATASVPPQLWKPTSGIVMTNDTADTNPEESVPCFALSKNDSYVMSTSGGKISLFDMMTFKTMRTFMPPPPAATSLAFHPQDNNIIAIGMDDSTIQIYDVRVDEVKSKLKGHSKRVTGLAFSHALNVLVSSGADAQLCVWSLDGWEKQKSRFLRVPSKRTATAMSDTHVQFHQDQIHFLAVHVTQLAIYETTKLECENWWVPGDYSAPISHATFSCDSQLVYACFVDATVCIYSAADLRLRCRINPVAYLPANVSSSAVYPLVVAAHPLQPNQFALGLTDGGVLVFEPLEAEGEWGVNRSVRRMRIDAVPNLSPDYIVDGWYVVYNLQNPYTYMKPDGHIPTPVTLRAPEFDTQDVAQFDASGEEGSPIFGIAILVRDALGNIHAELEGYGCIDFHAEYESEYTTDDERRERRASPTSLLMELFAAKVILHRVDPVRHPDLLLRTDSKAAKRILQRLRFSSEFVDILNPKPGQKDLKEMLALMKEIRELIYTKFVIHKRRLLVEWGCRERNCPMDRLSHVGRELGVPGIWIPYPQVEQGKDWTYVYLLEVEIFPGISYFCVRCKICNKYGHEPESCPKTDGVCFGALSHQVHHDSSGVVPLLPIPATSDQQQPRKDLGEGLAPAAAVDVAVKPAPVNESAKLRGPPRAAGLQFPHEIYSPQFPHEFYSVQQSKSVLEPVGSVSPSITVKDYHSQRQENASDSLDASKSFSSVVAGVAKRPETSQDPPSEVEGLPKANDETLGIPVKERSPGEPTWGVRRNYSCEVILPETVVVVIRTSTYIWISSCCQSLSLVG